MRLSAGLTFDDLRRDMLAMARMVAPEIDQPLHILRQQDVPRLPVPFARAWCQRQATPATQVALQDAGLWRGPGPVVIFRLPLVDRLESFGVFAHEVTHLVPFAPAVSAEYSPTDLFESFGVLAAWAAEPPETVAARPPWADGHGPTYIRAAAHVRHRLLEVCALDIPPRYIVHEGYAPLDFPSLIRSLRPELGSASLDAPFAEILAAAPPAEFLDLFEEAERKWRERYER
ncbi:MAG: hypothetical protein GXY58_10755 [Planctomycetaceae bacterium]|nr:hypothetical protein [Planctomycetaceae bacterium]